MIWNEYCCYSHHLHQFSYNQPLGAWKLITLRPLLLLYIQMFEGDDRIALDNADINPLLEGMKQLHRMNEPSLV